MTVREQIPTGDPLQVKCSETGDTVEEVALGAFWTFGAQLGSGIAFRNLYEGKIFRRLETPVQGHEWKS